MSMRTFSLALASIALASCGPESQTPEGTDIDCAIGAGVQYARVCTLEKLDTAGGEIGNEFLIHHPDGGFRRIRFDVHSGEVVELDGAEKVETVDVLPGGTYEFSIAGDRYIIPLDMLWDEAGE
ncbi:MAG: hypothetical protein AAGK02_13170 [Pseudomonadota bacterium]